MGRGVLRKWAVDNKLAPAHMYKFNHPSCQVGSSGHHHHHPHPHHHLWDPLTTIFGTPWPWPCSLCHSAGSCLFPGSPTLASLPFPWPFERCSLKRKPHPPTPSRPKLQSFIDCHHHRHRHRHRRRRHHHPSAITVAGNFQALPPTPCTLHPTPCTLHPAPCTLHPTPYTLHPTTRTLHPTPHTLHSTPYTLHPIPYTLHPRCFQEHPIPRT